MNGSDILTKLIVIPTTLKQIYDLMSFCDGYIISIKNLSVNMPSYFTIDEVKKIIVDLKKEHKHIYINLNKNFHNGDLLDLRQTLITLDNLNIDGIMYYDIAVVNLKDRLGLKSDLIWAQEHMTTNYATCNYWYHMGIKHAYLSSEITYDEIVKIKQKTKMGLFVNVFGYLPMFTSKRHLVTNYLKTFNLTGSHQYFIAKEGHTYPIVDDDIGTTVYSANILNAFDEYLNFVKMNIDCCVINSFLINDNSFEMIVKNFKKVNENNKEKLSDDINKLLLNKWDKGFLYKETVYKVKKNDKNN